MANRTAINAEIYLRFEHFERRLALTYLRLHKRFVESPPVANFWMHAALDEVQHASILRFCRDQQVFSVAGVTMESADQIDDLLASTSAVISKDDLTLREAFYAALLVEASELDDIYGQLTIALAERHPEVYATVQLQIQRHHEQFAAAADRFVGDPAYGAAFRNLSKTHQKQVV
jgi:hypothetical protein